MLPSLTLAFKVVYSPSNAVYSYLYDSKSAYAYSNVAVS